MALKTTVANGTLAGPWAYNDFLQLLTGVMADQPVTLLAELLLKALGSAPSAPTATVVAGAGLGTGTYSYVVTLVDGLGGETRGGQASSVVTTSTGNQQVNLTAIPTGPTGTAKRKIYRTVAGGSQYLLLATLNDNTTTTYTDTTADASLGTAQPPNNPSFGGSLSIQDALSNVVAQIFADGSLVTKSTYNLPAAPTAAIASGTGLGIGAYQYVVTWRNAAGGESAIGAAASVTTTSGNQKVNLTAIPTGPQGTMRRNIYRTAVGGSSFLLLTTLHDNTTTTYTDTVADGSLGSAAPTVDSFGPSWSLKNSTGTTKTVLRADGSASFAGGNTTIDEAGNINVASIQVAGGALIATGVQGGSGVNASDPYGWPMSPTSGRPLRTGSFFSGTGTGTVNHNMNGGQTPTAFLLNTNASGSQTYGYDTVTSSTVHITAGGSLAWTGISCKW